jgi:hypothetical protein
MLAQFAKGRPFATALHLETKDVAIEFDRFFGIRDLDHDMIASIDLDRHG